MKYGILLAATVVAALAACGGNDEQAQAQSPAIETTTPAGNAGPPPGAAPASGVGDANSAPTSASAQPVPMDGSTVGADGADGASMTGGTSQDPQPANQTEGTTEPPAQ